MTYFFLLAALLTNLAALSCSHLERLTNSEPEPETPSATEPLAARDTIRVELPDPAPTPLTPQEARRALSNRGIPYNQVSFIDAAAQGDLAVVRLFVEAGLSVDVQPYTAKSVLVSTRVRPTSLSHMRAAFYPEEGEQDTDTALMKAAGNGYLEVVQFLVDQGADLLLRNQQNQTAAMFAAAGGHLEVLKYIGYSKKSYSQTGLYGGVMPVWYDFVEKLPESVMFWACFNGHMDVVRFLREEYGVTEYPWYNMGWAVLGGHQDIAEYFLDVVKDWESADNKGINGQSHLDYMRDLSLVLASHTGDEQIVRWLLDEGANIHYRVKRWLQLSSPEGQVYLQVLGNSPIHIAISEGHLGVVRILLEHWMHTQGADGRDPHGLTALMLAAAGGDIEMAKVLMDNGAPVNARTDVGTTALMFAAGRGQVAMLRLLLDSGADASLENAHGYTALALAQVFEHDEAVAILEQER